MRKPRVVDAIRSLVPEFQGAITGGVITWYVPTEAPVTQDQIDAELVRLQAEYDTKEYQRLRADAYPPITDQLDMQYWDHVNGTVNWETAVATIKAKYPKV
jgi:hypothetical protein